MNLSKKDFCEALKVLRTTEKEEQKIFSLLTPSPEWIFSKWINRYYELLIRACGYEGVDEKILVDLLDWFCYETDFGEKEEYNKIYDADSGEIVATIDSPEVLYDYLMATLK